MQPRQPPPVSASPPLPESSTRWAHSLTLEQQCSLAAALTPRWNKYLQRLAELRNGLFPSAPQHAFLLTDNIEDVLFGGAAGGGKSEALLGAALQYVDMPGYASLLFRNTYADLHKPDALIPRAREVLSRTDAHWKGDTKEWVFPSGATLGFGYLEHDGDAENFQGAAAQYWGFDEAGQLKPKSMMYLKSRARRRADVQIPVRFRYSANPGGRAHEWLVENFIMGAPHNGKLFIPSKAVDNPGLDVDDYLRRLADGLDDVLLAQLRDGDWGAMDRSGLVCPEWTPAVEAECVVTEDHFEPYFTAYAAADPGGHSKEAARDLFAMGWGHLNFIQGLLWVTDERAWRNPDTETIGTEAVAVETLRWGAAKATGAAEAVFRFTDLDGRLVNDLKKPPYLLSWAHTAKTEAAVWERQLRTAIKQRKIRIHARCVRLLKTLKYARFTDSGDYERTEDTGHADLWKMLVYMYRNVNWRRNPYPPPAQLPEHRLLGQQHTGHAREIHRATKGKALRPLK